MRRNSLASDIILFSFFLIFSLSTQAFNLDGEIIGDDQSSSSSSGAGKETDALTSYLESLPKEWKFSFEKGNVHIYSKETGQKNLLAFKGVTVINAPVLRVLQVIRNIEESHLWTPNLRHKEMIHEYTYIDAVTYNINELPWPASDRDTVVRSTLTLDKKRRGLNVFTKSVDHKKFPPKKGLVRAIIYSSNVFVRPIGKNKTLIDLDALVDPKGLIPNWLSNLVQKKFPYNFIKATEKRAKAVKAYDHPSFLKILDELRPLL